jgi:hypothetical protein
MEEQTATRLAVGQVKTPDRISITDDVSLP